MGEVISLDHRRRSRERAGGARQVIRGAAAPRPSTTFWFDLASPSTYLAAERADRLFPGLEWRPALVAGASAQGPLAARVRDIAFRAAVARAAELRMPLVRPEGDGAGGHAAMRVASFAAERGQGSAFVLAASRLAFCGGFDLDDPEILAEAAAAAALPLEACLQAAGDRSRDTVMRAAGNRLVDDGASDLPVLGVGRSLFCGEQRLDEAVAALRDRCPQPRPAPLDEFAG